MDTSERDTFLKSLLTTRKTKSPPKYRDSHPSRIQQSSSRQPARNNLENDQRIT